jgi:predicted metal-dependent peptidase
MEKDVTRFIKKQNIAIMGNKTWMATGGILCFGKWTVSDSIPTACTDGKNVWYGREFCADKTEPEMRFLILHEAMHKMARHMQVYKTIHTLDQRRANAACDYWINGELIKQDDSDGFIKMIKGGLYNPKYYGMSVIQIFKDLEDKGDDKEGEGGEGEGDGKGTNQCPSETDGNGNEITNGYPKGSGFDEHDWEGGELSDEDKETLAKDIEIAIRQGRQLAGKMEGGQSRLIDGMLEGKVDWKKELADFIKATMAGRDESSWSKLNRRMFHVGYFPSSIAVTTGRIAIGIDTSGSIWGEILTQFIGEVKKLCAEVQPAGLDIIWWDMDVCGVQSFEQDQLDNIDQLLKPIGGGGTSPQCVAEWLSLNKKLNHECLVMLSDGYVDSFPVFNIPTLWAICSDVIAENAKTVRISEDM